jgi:hypothetical protein
MKTGPVTDVQQTKQCGYNTPCECGRCYISETSRTLEVRSINIIWSKVCSKNQLAQHAHKKGHKSEGRGGQTKRDLQDIRGICPHLWRQNPYWTYPPSGLPSLKQKTTTLVSLYGKVCLTYVGTTQMPYLSLVLLVPIWYIKFCLLEF